MLMSVQPWKHRAVLLFFAFTLCGANVAPRYTFKAQNESVRGFLGRIADTSHVSIVIADDVRGTLNLSLRNVTADQAFSVVAQARGYNLQRRHGILCQCSGITQPTGKSTKRDGDLGGASRKHYSDWRRSTGSPKPLP